MQCPFKDECPFFNNRSVNLESFDPMRRSSLKSAYCLNAHHGCAHNILRRKGIAIPEDLLPDEIERAQGMTYV